jgi:hypothetical protein
LSNIKNTVTKVVTLDEKIDLTEYSPLDFNKDYMDTTDEINHENEVIKAVNNTLDTFFN